MLGAPPIGCSLFLQDRSACAQLHTGANPDMSATYPTKVSLAFKSGGVCAFHGCGRELTYEGTSDTATVGEAAHIRGEKPDAARYDASMTDAERDHIDNLIYLCGDHHTIIDKLHNDFSVDDLSALKVAHEERVREAMEEAFASVGFPELAKAIEWICITPPGVSVADFTLLSPEDKIARNQLSVGSRHIIASGLSSRNVVAQFVETETQLDPDFPERLKAGFLAEYYKLRHEGYLADELFNLMCAYAQRGARSQMHRTAGLAVLVYLFEICDVFEK